MKIIISPAKKMQNRDDLPYQDLPVFLDQTERLLQWLRGQSPAALRKLWGCNEAIAALNRQRLQEMELTRRLSPAILSYEGIQYQTMSPNSFETAQFEYVQAHVCILSGFYGILRPMDGVTPYRLEMQAKAAVDGHRDLYDFWGAALYHRLSDTDHTILNLASKEYAKAVRRHLTPEDRFITVDFAELVANKPRQTGVYAKMARGELVRQMALYQITQPEDIRTLQILQYSFAPDYSDDTHYVFLKNSNIDHTQEAF